jgi:integrase
MIYHLYRRPKKNGIYWVDLRVNGCRYREPLGTRDKSEAHELMLKRVEQLKTKAPDPAKRSKAYGSMDIKTAIEAYSVERRAQVSSRMVAYWKEQARPLANHFGELKLKRLTVGHLNDYQSARLDAGKAPKTVNGELSVLRQLLKHAKYWYRFSEDYRPVRNNKRPVGRALSHEEQKRLFETAALWRVETPLVRVGKDGKTYKLSADWQYAHAAATLAAYCGLRACEIKALQWKDVDFAACLLEIRRSKTPGGWRTPTLNSACAEVLAGLYETASLNNGTDPEHYVFPWQGREQKIDPTRPITSWRSAWRSILKQAGIKARFHDLRHTAVTTMAEEGLPDLTIMAQVGHVSPQMMKTYSHIRRQALNQAAAVLEPNFPKTVQAELVN